MATTRRHFLAAAASGLATPLMAQDRRRSPNDNIQVALIGAGGQGSGDARSSIAVGGVKLVAVSDIYDGRLTRAKEVWGSDLFTTRDYREVLARPDIDAVIIGTPGSLASPDQHRRDERGQGRVLRKAHGAARRRRQAGHRGRSRRPAASCRSAASASVPSSIKRPRS